MATTQLEKTSSVFKLVGKVKGLVDEKGNVNEYALREDVTKTDKQYKALSFFIETSPVNAVKVELFSMERDQVVFWNGKEKDRKKARKDVNWEDRHKSFKPFGLMGMKLGLKKGSNGKNITKTMVEWDAVDEILSTLKDGDDVFVSGEIDFQQYQDDEGNWKESTKFAIKSISLAKNEVDFEAEDFEEYSKFEQEIVSTDVEVDGKKLLVSAKTINYKGEHVDTQLVVDGEKYPKLAKNMNSRLKFGDFIKTFGQVINRVEREELAEEDMEDDSEDWGGDEDIKKDFDDSFIRKYVQELQITSVDSSTYETKKYSEEDFFSEDESNFDGDFDNDDFDGEEDTEVDDDLPFG